MWAARHPQGFHRGKLTWSHHLYGKQSVLAGVCRKTKMLLILLLELHTAAEEASVTQMLFSSIHSCSSAVCHSTLLTSPPVLALLETPLPSVTQKPLRSQFWFHLSDCYGCSGRGLPLPRELPRDHMRSLSLPFPPFGWEAGLTSLCPRLLGKRKLDQARRVSGKVKLVLSVWVMLRVGMLEKFNFTTLGRQPKQTGMKRKDQNTKRKPFWLQIQALSVHTGCIHHTAYSPIAIRSKLFHPNIKLKTSCLFTWQLSV